MAGEKTKQIGVAHQHKHNRNKQNRKTKQQKKELESQQQQQHGNTTLAFLHRVSLMDEMCVCVPVSLFGFSELSSSALYFISFLFDYDLSFVCVAVGDAIDESAIKVALGFYGQK
jgi:hypothetical protein